MEFVETIPHAQNDVDGGDDDDRVDLGHKTIYQVIVWTNVRLNGTSRPHYEANTTV